MEEAMRTIALFVILASLTGCATMHRDDGVVQTSYFGPSAREAAALLAATNDRPFDLADKAMDKGMSTTLRRDIDGNVGFRAGYNNVGYGSGGYGYGGNTVYAAPDIMSVPGGWYAGTGAGSQLPILSQPVVGALPSAGGGSDPIVPCPAKSEPQTVAQQAACADKTTRILMRMASEE